MLGDDYYLIGENDNACYEIHVLNTEGHINFNTRSGKEYTKTIRKENWYFEESGGTPT